MLSSGSPDFGLTVSARLEELTAALAERREAALLTYSWGTVERRRVLDQEDRSGLLVGA